MGSPVSAVVANLVMEDIEERVLATLPKQYVDDVCVSMRKIRLKHSLIISITLNQPYSSQ